MRFEGAQPPLIEALGRQQQVNPKPAPDASHPDEEVDQLGAGGEELRELVDHEQQRRQCSVAGCAGRRA